MMATVCGLERLRCNLSQQVYSAEVPQEPWLRSCTRARGIQFYRPEVCRIRSPCCPLDPAGNRGGSEMIKPGGDELILQAARGGPAQ